MSAFKSACHAMGDWRRMRPMLVARREEIKMSQGCIADFCGVSRETVGRWERGTSDPTATNLFVWAGVLDLRLEAVPVSADCVEGA